MTFAAPWLAALGVILALGPILLHRIARRPPSRAPLPTARFLQAESRSRIRWTRRPTDVALMALRSLFLLVLLLAISGPAWTPPRSGNADLVLVDASADPQAVADTLARLPGARVLTFGGPPGSADHADLAAALEALPAEADRLSADSVRAWLVMAPRWAAWTPGTAAARAAWTGGIEILPVPGTPLPAAAPPHTAAVVGDTVPLARAIRALGVALVAAGEADVVFVEDSPVTAGVAVIVEDALRRGATVVLPAGDGPPGVAPVHAGDMALDASGHAVSPDGPARVLAAWHDGAPAAFATVSGNGCRVIHGIDFASAATELPALLARLGAVCEDDPDPLAPSPLDAGALAVLRGGGAGPVAVPAGGRPLTRPLLVLALLLAALEMVLVLRRDGTRSAARGTSAA